MANHQYWSSPAKLNLFLYITGRRSDGYHNLQTLFQFIDYCDYLYFEARNDNRICLATEFIGVNHDDNLIIKAANLLVNYVKQVVPQFSIPYGFTISIDKKLPMGGGLGGGSSNAATTLVALNQLWQLGLTCEQLMLIGKTLGADVPVFIFGHSAFAQGIGDELVSVDITEQWYLVVKPDIEISTAKIFTHSELKRDTVTRSLLELLTLPFYNDCEATVRALYPPIDELISLLSSQVSTRLTGTGSCIFCQCESQQQAQQLQRWLIKQTEHSSNITSFIAKACNNSPLLKA